MADPPHASHPSPHAAAGSARSRLGAAGERLAAQALAARGYRILATNWRCPYGELDVIAEDGAELVFVEVKTRRGTASGSPEEAITPAKRRRLLAAAQTYLDQSDASDRLYRFDIVAVDLAPGGTLRAVRLYRRAIEEE